MTGSGSYSVQAGNLASGAGMVHVGADQDQSLQGTVNAAAQTPAAGGWQQLVAHASAAGAQSVKAAESMGQSLRVAAVAYELADSSSGKAFEG